VLGLADGRAQAGRRRAARRLSPPGGDRAHREATFGGDAGATYGGCMYLENLVTDAVDPQRLGRFWEAAVGGERLTDEHAGFETRLAVEGGPVLDLCFQRVPEPTTEPPRLHVDLLGGTAQAEVVERLVGLGARHLDIGQGEVPWVVLADPEGNPVCVMEERAAYADSGPVAARAPPRLRRPGQRRRVLVLADRLDRGRWSRAPVPAPPVAARSPARAVPGAGAERPDQEPAAPRHPARNPGRPRRSHGGHRRARRRRASRGLG
jgi:hypothetical protein